ncbi:MAG: 50S ribosomal protein L9 [Actinobacteria bacterium]|nr:50S ribosomal protein L9 [Actinomycetota bacterium]
MKIVLKAEVDNLGLPGDVVDVADGYGRNYLIPRGLAIKATPGAMKEAAALTRSRKAREAKTLGSAEAAKNALEARTLRIPVRVDEAGHLYGSVRAEDVRTVLKARGHDIERRRIDLKTPIKQIGTYEVEIHVHPQVSATVEVEVVDQEGEVTVESLAGAKAAEERSIEEAALEAAAQLEGDEAAEGEPGTDATESEATTDEAARDEAPRTDAAAPAAASDEPIEQPEDAPA